MTGLLVTAIATGGCGGADPAPVDPAAEAAAVGTYTLTAVNTAGLPFQYGQSDTSRFEIVSGNIVLQANHDITRETTTTESRLSDGAPIGAESLQRHLGTWSLRGADSVRFIFPGIGTQFAEISSTTITIASGTNSLAYTK
jgi:hypothetical protein